MVVIDIDAIRAAICDPAIVLCLEKRARELEADCVSTARSGEPTYLYKARSSERAALWAALGAIRKLASGE